MGLWKYDTIVGLWHLEDGLAAIGDDITLVGTTTVPGKLDNAQSFTTNDYGSADGLITSLASVTKGTVAGWVYLDSDDGAVHSLMSCTKSAGTGATTQRLGIRINMVAASNAFDLFCVKDGVLVWQLHPTFGSMLPHVGSWLPYVIEHDGSKIIRVQLNGTDYTDGNGGLVRTTTTDESVWFAGILAAGADTFEFGSEITNSTRSGFLTGDLDETMINSELWDADDRAAFYNGGAGQVISAPSIYMNPTGPFGLGKLGLRS